MLEKQKNKKKVIVAMSGGVDSSVAAALLKKQGYEVAGVFMRFWGETPATPKLQRGERNHAEFTPLDSYASNGASAEQRGNLYCSEGAEKAARAVAAKLKIPFYVFNFQKEFKREVVDYFLREQKLGRTPNPCVVCNKKIKFAMMFKKAMALGADYIATGHYARLKSIVIPSAARNLARMGAMESVAGMRQRSFAPFRGAQDDRILYKLFAAEDNNKDQSYFLYTLSQKQLSRVLFPLGDYTKDEVYQLAKKWRLPYRQEESFDLCFVANDAESFIKKYLKLKAGKIVDYNNSPQPPLKLRGGEGELKKSLGQHEGLPLYTIGQRKSIPLSQGPWWVIKKDEKKNILYVSNNEKDLYSKELIAEKINWLSDQVPKLPIKVCAKIRYKSEASEATLRQVYHERGRMAQGKNQLKLIFKKPQRAITPGQSVVFYSKSGEVLGGGVIESQKL